MCVSSGGSDGGASTEPQQDVLTVLQRAPIPHALQGALGLRQQTGPVPRRGQQGEGQVATRQQDGMSPLPLTQDTVPISCREEEEEEGLRENGSVLG